MKKFLNTIAIISIITFSTIGCSKEINTQNTYEEQNTAAKQAQDTLKKEFKSN